jgi:hypothetical protein
MEWEKNMGSEVTSSVNVPANQTGRGSNASRSDRAAQTKFADAKQSVKDNGPTPDEELSNLCFPWDHDDGGLLKDIPAPRECKIPHTIVSPEALPDEDNAKPIDVPGETIVVNDKKPPESPLASAVRRGIAYIPTQDQFEKNLLWQANHFAKNWSMERWHDYIQGPPPEGLNDAQKFEWQKAATNWQDYVTKAYGQAYDKAEAQLLDNYRRIDVANSAVKSNLKFQLTGVFFAAVPPAGAIYGGWTTGVSGVEAVTGRKSGMQVSDLASGNWNDHRKLSTPERIGLGAEATLGVVTIGAGRMLERSSSNATRAESRAGVVSGEIDSRKLAGGAAQTPNQPKVIVDRKAYMVEPGQAGMSKALGLDPSKTRTVARASDGHGGDFHVVTGGAATAIRSQRALPPGVTFTDAGGKGPHPYGGIAIKPSGDVHVTTGRRAGGHPSHLDVMKRQFDPMQIGERRFGLEGGSGSTLVTKTSGATGFPTLNDLPNIQRALSEAGRLEGAVVHVLEGKEAMSFRWTGEGWQRLKYNP